MSTFPYLITTNDIISLIKEKYNCDEEELIRYNPLLRNQKPHLGQIIYIPDKFSSINQIDLNEIKKSLCEINYLTKDEYVSYHLKHNDHSLIEEELYDEYLTISTLIFKEDNDAKICQSHLVNIHQNLKGFIDSLQNKNEDQILLSRTNIKDSLLNLYQYLSSKKLRFDENKISSIIEFRMKMILLIINENYYDLKIELAKFDANLCNKKEDE